MVRLERIRKHIGNGLGEVTKRDIFGIIGETPSTSARSPRVWNHTFTELGMDAEFLAFDVTSSRELMSLVFELREEPSVKGFAVTKPYKTLIIPGLGRVDQKAEQIGAVNFVHKSEDGTLVGYNTDGMGGLASILNVTPGGEPLIDTLEGKNVLMFGAGGAARALAFYFAEAMGSTGRLYVANRNFGTARDLCDNLNAFTPEGFVAIPLSEEDPYKILRQGKLEVDLVVNASSKGSKGPLENYSALYSASPISRDEALIPRRNKKDLEINLAASDDVIDSLPGRVVFFDAVHTPEESVMLRQASIYGHNTLNGKSMNVYQAAKAFKIAYPDADERKILDIMYKAP